MLKVQPFKRLSLVLVMTLSGVNEALKVYSIHCAYSLYSQSENRDTDCYATCCRIMAIRTAAFCLNVEVLRF
jgi:hypothetical protein